MTIASEFDRTMQKIMVSVCKLPGMYTGGNSFTDVSHYINGYMMALSDMGQVPFKRLGDWEFQRFVIKKYGVGKQVTWWSAYNFSPNWIHLSDRERLDRLSGDYEEFANVLTRMAAALDE